jgi:cysteine-rich repeat protein
LASLQHRVSLVSLLSLAGGFASFALACSPEAADYGAIIVGDPEANQPAGGAGGAPTAPPPPGGGSGGGLYDAPPPPGCGDAEKADDEACDDGNTTDGDGCLGNCLVIEDGYTCDVPGDACVLADVCGDGRQSLGEACDDGNPDGGDGCSSSCQLEAGFTCPTPGQACVSNAVCGDGFVALGESCDDGNTYKCAVADNESILLIGVGQRISVQYATTDVPTIRAIRSVEKVQ